MRDRIGGPTLHVAASGIQDGDPHIMCLTGPLPHGRGSDRACRPRRECHVYGGTRPRDEVAIRRNPVYGGFPPQAG